MKKAVCFIIAAITAMNSLAWWTPGSQIEDNLKVMPDSMFMGSYYLDKLIIGPKVDTIGTHSIMDCRNMKNLYALPLNPPKFTNWDRDYLFVNWSQNVSLNLSWTCVKEFMEAYGCEQWMPLYYKKNGWKEFINWTYWDYKPEYYEYLVGVENITFEGNSAFGIHRDGADLVITGIADDETVRVFDLTGCLVAQTRGLRITGLSRGVYVIATRNGSHKIAF